MLTNLGGIDLRFPHHENERAQSNSAAGREVVAQWVHGEHLLFEGRKMSKSAGNVLLVSEIIAKGLDPLSLRLAFLENRYRSQIDLTWDGLKAADSTIKRWRSKLADWGPSTSTAASEKIISECIAHLMNDLGSADVAIVLRKVERDETLSMGERAHIFREMEQIFALDLDRKMAAIELTDEQQHLLAERAEARSAKNYARSDELRDQLMALGVTVKDSASGQEFELLS